MCLALPDDLAGACGPAQSHLQLIFFAFLELIRGYAKLQGRQGERKTQPSSRMQVESAELLPSDLVSDHLISCLLCEEGFQKAICEQLDMIVLGANL